MAVETDEELKDGAGQMLEEVEDLKSNGSILKFDQTHPSFLIDDEVITMVRKSSIPKGT